MLRRTLIIGAAFVSTIPLQVITHHHGLHPLYRLRVVLPASLLTTPNDGRTYSDVAFAMPRDGGDGIYIPQKRIFSDEIVAFLAYICNVGILDTPETRPRTQEMLKELGWNDKITPVYRTSVNPPMDDSAVRCFASRASMRPWLRGEVARKELRGSKYEHIWVAAWIFWQHFRP